MRAGATINWDGFEIRSAALDSRARAVGARTMKLEFPLIRYLGPAIEPGFDAGARDDWRLLVSPRLQRMWPEIPLEVRCAMVESFQKLYGAESAAALAD
jgi:hypothetical protein